MGENRQWEKLAMEFYLHTYLVYKNNGKRLGYVEVMGHGEWIGQLAKEEPE